MRIINLRFSGVARYQALLVSMLLCLSAVAREANSAAVPVTFSIPASSMEEALQRWVQNSKMQLLYDPQLVTGHSSPGVTGETSAERALIALLIGSDFESVLINPGTYIIRLKRKPFANKLPLAQVPHLGKSYDNTTQLDSVSVVGSRLAIPVDESALMATIIGREEIEAAGYTSILEVLQSRPDVVIHHSTQVARTDSALPIPPIGLNATVGVGMLGTRSTLYLVDGRRVAGYPVAFSVFGYTPWIDEIPIDRVERIEIMRGSGSSVYGTDALAGVVNVITRSNSSDSKVSFSVGRSSKHDGLQRRGYLRGVVDDEHGRFVYDFSLASGETLSGASRRWRTWDRTAYRGPDLRRNLRHEYYDFSEGVGPFYEEFESCPGLSRVSSGCKFDLPRYESLEPEYKNAGIGLSFERQLSNGNVMLDLRAASAKKRLNVAPVDLLLFSQSRFQEDQRYEVTNYAFLDLASTLRSSPTSWGFAVSTDVNSREWRWRTQGYYQENSETVSLSGALRASEVSQLSGYMIGSFNNSEDVLNKISPNLTNRSRSFESGFSAMADRTSAFYREGADRLLVGAEVRYYGIEQRPDDLYMLGDVLFGGVIRREKLSEIVASTFLEYQIDFFKSLAAHSSFRYDKRESYREDLSSRIAIVWKPTDAFNARLSFSKGFRSPTLYEYRSPSALATLLSLEIDDAQEKCLRPVGERFCEVDVLPQKPNNLRSESSITRSVAVAGSTPSGIRFYFDYVAIKSNHEIVKSESVNYPEAYPDLYNYDGSGRLSSLAITFLNEGSTYYKSINSGASFLTSFGSFGDLSGSIDFSKVIALSHRRRVPNSPQDLPYYNYPKTSALASVSWARGNFQTTLSVRRLGRSLSRSEDSGACIESIEVRCFNPKSKRLDLSFMYSGFAKWMIGMTVTNLLDEEPDVYYDQSRLRLMGYNPSYYDARGRYIVLTFSTR